MVVTAAGVTTAKYTSPAINLTGGRKVSHHPAHGFAIDHRYPGQGIHRQRRRLGLGPLFPDKPFWVPGLFIETPGYHHFGQSNKQSQNKEPMPFSRIARTIALICVCASLAPPQRRSPTMATGSSIPIRMTRTHSSQGLIFLDGHLYESTGQEGHSSLRMIDSWKRAAFFKTRRSSRNILPRALPTGAKKHASRSAHLALAYRIRL